MGYLSRLPLKCYIIEDEPLSIEKIVRDIDKRKELNLIGFSDDIELLEEILPLLINVDVLFLDIKVSGGSINSLQPYIRQEMTIVVITAYPKKEYPIFLKERADFSLWKPYTYEQFENCIDEVLNKRSYYNKS